MYPCIYLFLLPLSLAVFDQSLHQLISPSPQHNNLYNTNSSDSTSAAQSTRSFNNSSTLSSVHQTSISTYTRSSVRSLSVPTPIHQFISPNNSSPVVPVPPALHLSISFHASSSVLSPVHSPLQIQILHQFVRPSTSSSVPIPVICPPPQHHSPSPRHFKPYKTSSSDSTSVCQIIKSFIRSSSFPSVHRI